MSDIFTPVDVQTNDSTDPLMELVGEGKKYATPADLAKAKKEADSFIEQIKRENAELRERVSSQATVDEIMTQIKQLSPKPSQPVEPDNQPRQPASATPDDISKLVTDLLNQAKTKEKVQTNASVVEQKLLEKFGNTADAQIAINKKAKELGVAVDFLQKTALESPSAFFELIGLNRTVQAPAPVQAPVTRGGFTPPPAPTGDRRNQAYYDALKARDFKAYIDPKTQNQMMKDALQQGEAFYG